MNNNQNTTTRIFFWSFFETFGSQAIQFIIGVYLARLLSPEDYGLVGVLSVFTGIAGVLIDSGFKTSIIRTKDVTDKDCSTIFFTNLVVGLFISLLFFISSGYIASYFSRPELVNIVKVFAFIPLINGIGLIHSALIIKKLKFKLNAKISLISNLISGFISICLAINGFSYWALVYKALLMAFIYNILLWFFNDWKPTLTFSFSVLKKHFQFGSKLLLTGAIDTFFENIYSFIFGKFFSLKDLGFFTRGKGYSDLVTTAMSTAIQKVSTPLISSKSTNEEETFNLYSRLLSMSTLLIFCSNALLFSIAEPLIVFLLGVKWLPSIPYLQILSLSGMIYSILNSNSSYFEVMGRSDLILKYSLISRPLQIGILIITVQFNSITIAYGVLAHYLISSVISLLIVKSVSGKNISVLINPILKPLFIALAIGIIVFMTGKLLYLQIPVIFVILIQTTEALLIALTLMELLKVKELLILKRLTAKLVSLNPSNK